MMLTWCMCDVCVVYIYGMWYKWCVGFMCAVCVWCVYVPYVFCVWYICVYAICFSVWCMLVSVVSGMCVPVLHVFVVLVTCGAYVVYM